MVAVCVDYGCVFVLHGSWLNPVSHMLMAMEKVFGRIGIQQIDEAFEATMCNIISVSKAKCWRMGEKNVKAIVLAYMALELAYSLFHLPFCILIGLVTIIHTAAETENSDALMGNYCIIC